MTSQTFQKQWQASLGPRQVGADLETAGISQSIYHPIFAFLFSERSRTQKKHQLNQDRGEESQHRVGAQRMDQGTEKFLKRNFCPTK